MRVNSPLARSASIATSRSSTTARPTTASHQPAQPSTTSIRSSSTHFRKCDGCTRYGFIAEDTAAVDAHIATYDASSTVSGIDDRSIIAILVGAIKDLYAKVMALLQSDEAQNAEIERLKARVQQLEVAAGASHGGDEAPSGQSTSIGIDADRTTDTPAQVASSTPSISAPANETDPVADAAADETEAEPIEVTVQEPSADVPAELEAAKDNSPPPSAEAI